MPVLHKTALPHAEGEQEQIAGHDFGENTAQGQEARGVHHAAGAGEQKYARRHDPRSHGVTVGLQRPAGHFVRMSVHLRRDLPDRVPGRPAPEPIQPRAVVGAGV